MAQTEAQIIYGSLQTEVSDLAQMQHRKSYDKLLMKLPETITRNAVLDNLLSAIGYVIDLFIRDLEDFKNALSPTKDGDALLLDALAADYGLKRHPEDNNYIMAIRIHNAIQTHQQRGTEDGLITEGGQRALVSPYKVTMQMAIGINPIGVGWGLGGIGTGWIHLWNDSPESESIIETAIKAIVPFHYKDGIDYTAVYGGAAGFKSVRGSELDDGGSYTITNSGFSFHQNCLIPSESVCSYQLGNMDLGATFASYKWIADWIDYAHWDLSYSLVVSVRFSSDEIAWGSWAPYGRNQFIPDAELLRYAQFKLELTIDPGYESLAHYIFKRFVLKGLTSDQWLYGEEPRGSAFFEPEFGN